MSEHTTKLFFVFDVESVGLHGEGYAYGFVVVNQDGTELDAGRCSCDPNNAWGDASGRHWIAQNCPELFVSEPDPSSVRRRFADEWSEWSKYGAIMVADCPWPVEARFLTECVREHGMSGPYPLIDVGSVVLAKGGNPIATFDRKDNELPKHDPLADARQSARILIENLANIEDPAATLAEVREAIGESTDCIYLVAAYLHEKGSKFYASKLREAADRLAALAERLGGGA